MQLKKLAVALLRIPVCLGAPALKLKTLVCYLAYLGSDAVSLTEYLPALFEHRLQFILNYTALCFRALYRLAAGKAVARQRFEQHLELVYGELGRALFCLVCGDGAVYLRLILKRHVKLIPQARKCVSGLIKLGTCVIIVSFELHSAFFELGELVCP